MITVFEAPKPNEEDDGSRLDKVRNEELFRNNVIKF